MLLPPRPLPPSGCVPAAALRGCHCSCRVTAAVTGALTGGIVCTSPNLKAPSSPGEMLIRQGRAPGVSFWPRWWWWGGCNSVLSAAAASEKSLRWRRQRRTLCRVCGAGPPAKTWPEEVEWRGWGRGRLPQPKSPAFSIRKLCGSSGPATRSGSRMSLPLHACVHLHLFNSVSS